MDPFNLLSADHGTIRDNVSVPVIVGYMGVQALVLFIPIVLLEWVVSLILFKYLYKVKLRFYKLLVATLLSNLFSTLVGFITLFYILDGGSDIGAYNLTDHRIWSLVTMMAISILLEFPLLWLMLKKYLRHIEKDVGGERMIPIDGSMVLSYSLITCIVQNIVTYSISILYVVALFGIR